MFSFDSDYLRYYEEVDSSFLDFYEPHIWMAQRNGGELIEQWDMIMDASLLKDIKNLPADLNVR